MSKFYQGFYKILNKEKYRGDSNNCIYRSAFEKRFMMWLDKSPNVLHWSSEEIIINYKNKLDNKSHRYFVDFYVEFLNNSKFIIELKYSKYTKPPKKTSKYYISESYEFIKNTSKWSYAKEYADKNNMKFIILTEKEIGKEFSDRKIMENLQNLKIL